MCLSLLDQTKLQRARRERGRVRAGDRLNGLNQPSTPGLPGWVRTTRSPLIRAQLSHAEPSGLTALSGVAEDAGKSHNSHDSNALR